MTKTVKMSASKKLTLLAAMIAELGERTVDDDRCDDEMTATFADDLVDLLEEADLFSALAYCPRCLVKVDGCQHRVGDDYAGAGGVERALAALAAERGEKV
jgi:hypothetical protein